MTSEEADNSNVSSLPENLCPMPWTHLVQHTDGGYAPCCKYVRRLTYHGRKARTLKEAWESDEMLSLRAQFLNNERPALCHMCWSEESCGKKSDRTARLEILQDRFGPNFLPNIVNSGLPEGPISLDIKPGNLCNLKCRICSPGYSSKVAAEFIHMGLGNATVDPKPYSDLKWKPDSDNIQQLNQWLPRMDQMDIFGGEPLFSPDHLEILKTTVTSGHSQHIHLRYNTNGTIGPDRFVEYWREFKSVGIHFSIDDVGPRFEYQRKNASWDKVKENIQRFLDLEHKNIYFGVFITYSIQNIYYLEDVLSWATSLGLTSFLAPVHTPYHYNVRALPPRLRRELVKKIRGWGNRFLIHEHSTPETVINFLESEELPGQELKNFFDFTAFLDKARGEDFAKTFPELSHAINLSLLDHEIFEGYGETFARDSFHSYEPNPIEIEEKT